ncbi:hypothetical protein ACFE04_026768 [Oxalis oulophora]
MDVMRIELLRFGCEVGKALKTFARSTSSSLQISSIGWDYGFELLGFCAINPDFHKSVCTKKYPYNRFFKFSPVLPVFASVIPDKEMERAYIVSHVVAMFGMQISEEHVLHHFENVHRSRFLFCKQENRGVHCASMSTATESIPASVRSFVVGIERSKLVKKPTYVLEVLQGNRIVPSWKRFVEKLSGWFRMKEGSLKTVSKRHPTGNTGTRQSGSLNSLSVSRYRELYRLLGELRIQMRFVISRSKVLEKVISSLYQEERCLKCQKNLFECTNRCVCDSGYTGKNCESKFVPCNPSPCENHGICKPLDSLKYECKCKSALFSRHGCGESECTEREDEFFEENSGEMARSRLK